MKPLQFGKDYATIAGKRVPYSLLGAAAAILGAFLIWKFNQNGGLNLGQQSPDLAGLGAGSDLGSFGDLGNLVNTLPAPAPAPVYALGSPMPAYNYPATYTPAYSTQPVNFSENILPAPQPNYGPAAGSGDVGVGLAGFLGTLLRTPTAPPPAPSPTLPAAGTVLRQDSPPVVSSGGISGIFSKVDPKAAAKVTTASGGSGSFTF